MKAAVMRAVILLYLLFLRLIGSATAVAASPATTTLLQPPDGQGWAAARRLLLRQPTPSTATNTFHVKGAAHHQPAATVKPNVEFNASTRSAPGSRFNPRHN